MRFRFFGREDNERSAATSEAGSPPDPALFAHARELLAAGDEAIHRALSGDSQKFLASNRQRGGQ